VVWRGRPGRRSCRDALGSPSPRPRPTGASPLPLALPSPSATGRPRRERTRRGAEPGRALGAGGRLGRELGSGGAEGRRGRPRPDRGQTARTPPRKPPRRPPLVQPSSRGEARAERRATPGLPPPTPGHPLSGEAPPRRLPPLPHWNKVPVNRPSGSIETLWGWCVGHFFLPFGRRTPWPWGLCARDGGASDAARRPGRARGWRAVPGEGVRQGSPTVGGGQAAGGEAGVGRRAGCLGGRGLPEGGLLSPPSLVFLLFRGKLVGDIVWLCLWSGAGYA
jgi:hypothetical protein